jgi:hypothetical protein
VTEPVGVAGWRPRQKWIVGFAVLVLIGTWLLATPPNAGPDETGHLVRGAAVIDGRPTDAVVVGQAWITFPDIGCYALYEDRPASCSDQGPEPTGDVELLTRAHDYPIWGHIAPGVALEISSPSLSPYLPRLFAALIPALLVTAGLLVASRRSAIAGGVALLALTPMAWFTFAVVNPSSLVLAGAFAVWVVLTIVPIERGKGLPALADDWLLAAGLAALLLPRRDGVIWAALVLVAGCAAIGSTVTDRIRAVQVAPRILIASSTLLMIGWAAFVGIRAMGLVVLSAAIVVVYDVWWITRQRIERTALRWIVDIAALGALSVACIVTVLSREAGFQRQLFQSIVGETLPNLREAIGAVGTLDAKTPIWAIGVYLVALIVLFVSANSQRRTAALFARSSVVGIGVILSAVVAAWVLEMAQGNTSGTYWQGRYYLPLLMGVPMLFAMLLVDPKAGGSHLRLGLRNMVGAASVLISIVTFVVALRRWGVGTNGSWDPISWDTYSAPVSPVLLIFVHSAAIVTLALSVTAFEKRSTSGETDGAVSNESLA